MKTFKCRCSAIWNIMTSPRAKTETLSETTKSYLKQWYIEQKYGRRKEIDSKFLQKGLQAEEASISILNRFFVKNGREIFLKKNPSSFENDFLTGTPDLIFQKEIWDIKSSWDLFTFPFFDTEVPTKGYYYQLQGYMALTGLEKSSLCYVLTNTPESIIYDEARKLSYKNGLGGEITEELEENTRKNHTFDDIPLEDRIRIFEIPRDDSVIEEIYGKVEECRGFLLSF
jgi:hypothetical protein